MNEKITQIQNYYRQFDPEWSIITDDRLEEIINEEAQRLLNDGRKRTFLDVVFRERDLIDCLENDSTYFVVSKDADGWLYIKEEYEYLEDIIDQYYDEIR